jgi:hypothetical protein
MEADDSQRTPTTEEQEPSQAEASKALPLHQERAQFRQLILGNPNYFGNVKVSSFEPVLGVQSDTTYEAIGCVGLQPQFGRLEAVVFINQSLGYGGDVCSSGTPEYVRFYVSFDNGASWQDQGMVSFTAWDIPGDKPLEYEVTLPIHLSGEFCFVQNLPTARAILSWNNPPPPATPDFTPVWGNVVDARIQVAPLELIPLDELLKEAKVELPHHFDNVLNLAQPVSMTRPQTLNAEELFAQYADKGVPQHRFLFPAIQALIAKPALTESVMTPGFPGIFSELDVDVATVIGKLLETNGDTRYEELACVGLNPALNTLVGVVTIKLPNGYSGNLCSAGSQEYVAFWVDWGDGVGWTYAGTTSVTVHDITDIPAQGLQYAAFLPVDVTGRRKPCQDGPTTARVRAILSWAVPPQPSNPDYVPTWGNLDETLIHIKPGPIIPIGTHTPVIETVGNMAVTSIDGLTGLSHGPAAGAGFTAIDSPFGGTIFMSGHIAYPPDVVGGGAAPLKYRVSVSNDNGATWQPLTNTFTVWLTQLVNGTWSGPFPYTQSIDVNGWYTYLEDLIGGPGNPMQFVVENILAEWQTGAPMTGLWQIKIEAKDPVTNIIYPGTTTDTVCLDNMAPTASITITSGGGACADFLVGDLISGTYAVTDEHFSSLSLSVQPGLGGSFTSPAPLPRTYPIVPTTGESGTWSLDTTGMPRCGYVVYLDAYDRTIVNSGSIGFHTAAVVGLCLREVTDS